MQQPLEVEVDEDEQIVERVAAVDVAKASGMVCTRMPHESVPGKRVTKVWQVRSTTRALVELGDHLRCEGIQRVVLESTSDYWRPFYYLLQAAGLVVWLVNAAQAKNVPGRPKTDKIDAVWLAKLAERSMVSPSLVPTEPMRHVRDLARARFDLVEDRTRVKQRIEKLLEDALIKISSVLTDIHGVSPPSDDRGADRRAAQPHRARRAGQGPGPGPPRGPGRSPAGSVHRSPRPAGPDAAGPTR